MAQEFNVNHPYVNEIYFILFLFPNLYFTRLEQIFRKSRAAGSFSMIPL